jgi:hypothetical protein
MKSDITYGTSSVYIGKTGRNPRTRYKVHLRNIKKKQRRISVCPAYTKHGPSYMNPWSKSWKWARGPKKGRMMNIKENYYIYRFNHFNKLIHEQKHMREGDNQNSLFDIVVRYQHTPTTTSLNIRL